MTKCVKYIIKLLNSERTSVQSHKHINHVRVDFPSAQKTSANAVIFLCPFNSIKLWQLIIAAIMIHLLFSHSTPSLYNKRHCFHNYTTYINSKVSRRNYAQNPSKMTSGSDLVQGHKGTQMFPST